MKPTRGVGLTARNDEHRASPIHSKDDQPLNDQIMSNTRNPGTQEPPPKRKRPKKNTTNTDAEAVDALQQAIGLLDPLLDFLKPVEGATEDDLRIFWDVRVVRGKGSAFAHVTGSSSLPMALASNTKALAPAVVQAELLEKVSRPLTAVLQTVAEQLTMDELDARGGESFSDAGAAEPLS
jgi:hypothetical protein